MAGATGRLADASAGAACSYFAPAQETQAGSDQQEQPDRVHAGRLGVADGAAAATEVEAVVITTSTSATASASASLLSSNGDWIFNGPICLAILISVVITIGDIDFHGAWTGLIPEVFI